MRLRCTCGKYHWNLARRMKLWWAQRHYGEVA